MILDKDFDRQLVLFANALIQQLQEKALLEIVTAIDHVCYRVATLDDYERWKSRLGLRGVLLSEANVNGRPISSFKLHHPLLLTDGYLLDVIELPAPKPGRHYDEGFEHIEGVTSCSLELVLSGYTTMAFDRSNFSAPINRDIALQFNEGVVKFHEKSLETIIQEELASDL